ncbi:MAG: hypothetical protein OEW83_11605 [Acidimicrobiia bacterium]|nr:hypothetical protein [Acidimicrobiia bacterium]
MLIDEILPEYDTTIIEHLVVDAPGDVVYQTARNMDFLQIHSPAVDALMFTRGLPERLARWLRRRPTPPSPPAMRLADMFDGSGDPDVLAGWSALGEIPGRELVFGAIGKVWQPNIEWRAVTAEEFSQFSQADFAKIAAGFSIRPYGRSRSLLSYEARTAGTDDAARRRFLRYWWLVRRFVHIVMRAAVVSIKESAERNAADSASDSVDSGLPADVVEMPET